MTFWPEKFFADTAHLTWEERGAYLLLLNLAWVRGGGLPDDDQQLRRMVGCGSKKWRAMRPAVMAFWSLQEDGLWHQKRLDAEWHRANERTQRRASGHTHHESGERPKTHRRASGNADRVPRDTRSLAKNPMISTRARPDDPTPTPTSSSLLKEKEEEVGGNRGVKNGDSASATLSVLDAHASPPLKLDLSTRKERAERAAEMAKAVALSCAFFDDERPNVLDIGFRQ